MGEIKAAILRREKLKDAAGIGGPFGEVAPDADTSRRALSGSDLSLDEIDELMPMVRDVMRGAMEVGIDPVTVAAGSFFDGMATGVMIAESR